MSLNNHCKRWGLILLLCTVWSTTQATGRAALPVPPPEAVKQFDAAVQSRDVEALLAVFRRIAQPDTKEAVLAIVYAGLSESVLARLSGEQTL